MVATILISFGACDVVSIDSGMLPSESENSIVFEDLYPTSVANAHSVLTGAGSRSWSVSSFTIENISGFQQCRLDDQIVMNTDGSFAYDGGGLLCGAEDSDQLKSGTWSLDYTTRTLTFVPDIGDQIELYVETLTGQEVVFSTSYIGLDILGKLNKN